MEQQEQPTNTLSQLLTIAKNAELEGKQYQDIIMLVAPFELKEVQENKNILNIKLATELDLLLEEQGVTETAVYSIITPSEFIEVEELYRRCEYTPTDDTVIAARVFGVVDNETQPECLPYYVLCKDKTIGLVHKSKVKDEHLI